MITKQEREMAKHEIADISYDLSVRDGILGLDQVKDVLRKSQPSHHSTHTIGVDYDNWRLAITQTDRLGHIEINRSHGAVSVDIVIGGHRAHLSVAGDSAVHYIADDLGELIRTPLEALKVYAICTSVHYIADNLGELIRTPLGAFKIYASCTSVDDGRRELKARRAGIHPVPSIPGYTWSHSSLSEPFVLHHTLVRDGGAP